MASQLRAVFLITIISLSVLATPIVPLDNDSTGIASAESVTDGGGDVTVRTNRSVAEPTVVEPGDAFNTTTITVENTSSTGSSSTTVNAIRVNITDGTTALDIGNRSPGTGNLVDNVTIRNTSTGAVLDFDASPNTTSASPTAANPHFNITNLNTAADSKYNFTVNVTLNTTFGNVTDDQPFATNTTVIVNDAQGNREALAAGETGGSTRTQTLNTGTITNTTTFTQAVDSNASINITYSTTSADTGIDEGSIDLSVRNLNISAARNTTTLVQDGDLVNGVTQPENTLDDTNDSTESINLSIALQEGYYNFSIVNKTIKDDNNNTITADSTLSTGEANFLIDMSGSQYAVFADSSKPANTDGTLVASEIAKVAVVVQDTNGKNVTFNDSNINALGNDTQLLNDSGLSVTTKGPFNSSAGRNPANEHTAPVDGASDVGSPIWFNVSNTEAETVTLTANDSSFNNGQVNNGTAIQSFSTQMTQTTSDVVDAKASINISIDAPGISVNESSINVTIQNINTTDRIELVRNGDVVNGSLTTASTLDDTNDSSEIVNINLSLQEGHYNFTTAAATDLQGSTIGQDGTFTGQSDFAVNMSGQSLNIVTDSSNPRAGTNATIKIVALDSNDNRLTLNDSNVYANVSQLGLSYDDATNVAGEVALNSSATRPTWNQTGFKVQYNINYTEVGELSITASDFGDDPVLGSATANQTYTGTIKQVSVTAQDGTLRADGSDWVNVTLQLQDTNGNAITRSGESVSWSVTRNKTSAGVTINSKATTTDSNGEATINLSASTAGYTVAVTGTSNGFSDTATFSTTPGAVDASTSQLTSNGNTNDPTVGAGDAQTFVVTATDINNNPIDGASVTWSVNNSNADLSTITGTTNSSGQATTTVTMPNSTGTVAVNVSVGAFNASATGAARQNVTVQAQSPSQVQFGEPSRILAAGANRTITIQITDQFGNANGTGSYDVTLESKKTSVFKIKDGSSAVRNRTKTIADGENQTDFKVVLQKDTGSGVLNLTATGGLNSNEDTFQIGTPAQIKVWFDNNRVGSTNTQQSNTRQKTTMYAQLQDKNGNNLDISGETVNFARTSGDAAELNGSHRPNFNDNTNSSGVATIKINATSNTGDTTFKAVSENYTANGQATLTTTGVVDSIQLTANDSSPQVNDTVRVSVTLVDSQGRQVPRTSSTSVSLTADGGEFAANNDTTRTVTINYPSSETATANHTSASAGDVTIDAIGAGVTGSTTISYGEAQVASGSVTFNDQTRVSGKETVTVASADYSLADGTAGDYVVVVHVVFDNGSISDPVGYSSAQSGSASSITVDLNASEAQGDSLDSITENVTLQAMLHETSGSSAFGSAIQISGSAVTDNADITVTEKAGTLDELEDQYASDGDDITGDTAAIQSAISDWSAGTLTDVDGDGSSLDEIQALIQRWAGNA